MSPVCTKQRWSKVRGQVGQLPRPLPTMTLIWVSKRWTLFLLFHFFPSDFLRRLKSFGVFIKNKLVPSSSCPSRRSCFINRTTSTTQTKNVLLLLSSVTSFLQHTKAAGLWAWRSFESMWAAPSRCRAEPGWAELNHRPHRGQHSTAGWRKTPDWPISREFRLVILSQRWWNFVTGGFWNLPKWPAAGAGIYQGTDRNIVVSLKLMVICSLLK